MSIDGLIDKPSKAGLIVVGIDAEQYRQIVEDLIGELPTTADSVLKRAINATAKRVGRELANETQDRYRVKKLRFAKEIRYHLASNDDLSAELVAKGESLAASHFQTNPSKPDKPTFKGSIPVKLAILRDTTPSIVQSVDTGLKAFLTQFESGHIAVVQRQPPDTYTGSGWKKRAEKHKDFLKRSGKLDNTRIKQFFGPSAAKMLEKTGVTEKYIDENMTRIQGYLEDYILTFLNRDLYFANKKSGGT